MADRRHLKPVDSWSLPHLEGAAEAARRIFA
jgi:hypothetical protein